MFGAIINILAFATPTSIPNIQSANGKTMMVLGWMSRRSRGVMAGLINGPRNSKVPLDRFANGRRLRLYLDKLGQRWRVGKRVRGMTLIDVTGMGNNFKPVTIS
ncbi:hypothetical protein FRC08_001533 [Ceratobasidium sp. 394]|nr:hypothetical protein FRC08_001533 [Ceratobasidium sp. 394]